MNAAWLRSRNETLDGLVATTMDLIDPARLHELEPKPAGEEAWSAAMVLAHLGEFPWFFAGELRRFLADPAAPVGRTHEHPERLAAVAAARGRSYEQLRAGVTAAAAELAAVLRELDDRQLVMTTNNRRYGPEPLTAFLDRYVIRHKQEHVNQLAPFCREAP
ncbi:maleylpyruvate isomerase N-terminal domain-containing protein [Plantactinospora sp. GCM10030261]|uniref:maleylpyruvate isomerase N-terminal domain-containing protein n=1 Tax=Plantactinospora sp. GCM10030261 TaxID=3273420 RepID=UPI00361485B0